MGPLGASVAGVETATIQNVLREFLAERTGRLAPPESRLYRHVVLFLELCINNYGHRNLDEESRERYERLYRNTGGRREFFELFGPELLLAELEFFTSVFLKTEVHTSDKVMRKAKEVAAELRLWLVDREFLTPSRLKELDEGVKSRERLKRRLRPILRRLGRNLVTVDASMMAEDEYVGPDAHLVGRVEPGRVWLRVHRGAAPEEIGPVILPEEITRHLRRGFTLGCALARLQGRWRLVEFSEVHARG